MEGQEERERKRGRGREEERETARKMKGKEEKMGRVLVKEAVGVSERGKKRRKRETAREQGKEGERDNTSKAVEMLNFALVTQRPQI